MKETEETDYIRLPKRLIDQIKDLDNADKVITKYIEESKRDIKNNLDFLEDEVIAYKGSMAKTRIAFNEAKEEALAANYKIWENFEEDKKQIWNKSKEIVESLKPLTEELSKINRAIDGLNTYRLDELMKTIQAFSGLWGENKEMMEFLMKNYKKDEA